jgi:predicted RNA-binding Zn ribbon-like protein
MSQSRFELIGGAPALDLVNTVSWRGAPARAVDHIADPDALVRWAERAGILTAREVETLIVHAHAEPRRADRVVAEVRRLRESLYAALVTGLDDGVPDRAALVDVRGHIVAALAHSDPAASLPLSWEITVDAPEDLHHALALCADDALRRLDAKRLRRCANASCGWLFLDRSRNRGRLWCSSGDCGNRERVRRHRAQRRSGR